MNRLALLAAIVAPLVIVGAFDAQAQEPIPIYCLDSTGVAQPMKYVNSANLRRGYESQFHWKPFLTRLTETSGRLVFSRDGTRKVREWIAYDVEQHNDGLLLRVMHAHFPQKIEDVTGNEMCIKTQMIAMGQ